ncbi:MAG: hypothetical protein VXA34_00375 [Gammaproteobacteria bacterium]|jgi:hypothetical protein
MRRATDMTVEEFKEHLEQKMDEVLHFDKYRVGQRRVTRTQQGYTRAAMRRGKGGKWGYGGEHI